MRGGGLYYLRRKIGVLLYVAVCRCVWLCVAICGYTNSVWQCVTLCDCVWLFVAVCGCEWLLVAVCAFT